jgi:hypothetical protein
MLIQVRLGGDSILLQNTKKFLTRYKVSSLVYICYDSLHLVNSVSFEEISHTNVLHTITELKVQIT